MSWSIWSLNFQYFYFIFNLRSIYLLSMQSFYPSPILACLDWGGEGWGMGGSKVELAKNKLILGQLYSTLPPSSSIQIDHKRWQHNSFLVRIYDFPPRPPQQFSPPSYGYLLYNSPKYLPQTFPYFWGVKKNFFFFK